MSQLFASGGQSIAASASASVLPMNIQGLFPLGLTGLVSLLFKEQIDMHPFNRFFFPAGKNMCAGVRRKGDKCITFKKTIVFFTVLYLAFYI